MKNQQKQLLHRLILLLLVGSSQAFTVPTHAALATTAAVSKLPKHAVFHPPTTTTVLATETIDPTTVLTDVLGGLIASPLILAVPIVAALAVAALVVFFIFSYASPVEQDDDDD